MNKMHLSRLIGQHEFWLGLLVVALAVGLSVSTDEFLSLGNLTDVATSYAILGILACGLFVVLISGGIDISFPAMTAIAQYAMASWVIGHGGNFALALTIAIAVGLLLGLINGFLVYWLRVPAIIITIATLNVYYGLLVYATSPPCTSAQTLEAVFDNAASDFPQYQPGAVADRYSAAFNARLVTPASD